MDRLPRLKNSHTEWARLQVGDSHLALLANLQRHYPTQHWSRRFEYPWALLNGKFKKSQWVLDAAGGDGPMQVIVAGCGANVINIDIDPSRQPPARGVLSAQGDLRSLTVLDGAFDRVLCVSVLEHIEAPETALTELWRVLKPGGRLVLTFDVASYARWNHTIDERAASMLLRKLKLECPVKPGDILEAHFPEIEPGPAEPKEVALNVICAWADKEE